MISGFTLYYAIGALIFLMGFNRGMVAALRQIIEENGCIMPDEVFRIGMTISAFIIPLLWPIGVIQIIAGIFI